ncbi:hypothetical protein OQA88_2340 [Cercophora sp. LCS_1]
MKGWLEGGALDGSEGGQKEGLGGSDGGQDAKEGNDQGSEEGRNGEATDGEEKKRVVVVHCKAGKGRSGTMACSYLIAECGWTPQDALARFTERRMRPKFGAGVSIPSQLRWVSYVDRWTRGGKKYVDREVEIVEVHVWGLRHGVKVSVEGFADEGKKIEVFHTFKKDERIVVEGDAPGGNGVMDFVSDMAGYGLAEREDGEVVEDTSYEEIVGGEVKKGEESDEKSSRSPSPSLSRSDSGKKKGSRASSLMRKISTKIPRSSTPDSVPKLGREGKSKTIAHPELTQGKASSGALGTGDESQSRSTSNLSGSLTFADPEEPGGRAVIFKPAKPIRILNSDINIAVERRNRAHASVGLTMVTAVAHVWFNTFFEGNGPEQDGKADDSGVFEIDWDRMDGIKGSSQRGTRACDRLSVVWRIAGTSGDGITEDSQLDGLVTTAAGVTINEPAADLPVPQMKPADWAGTGNEDAVAEKRLGLRVQDTESANISKASSVKSEEFEKDGDDESLEGVKVSGPLGEEVLDDSPITPVAGVQSPAAKSNDEKADATAKKGFIVE